MQKQILVLIASFTLLCGCGGKNKEIAASTPATAPLSAQQPPQNDAKPQPVSVASPDPATGEKVYKSTCSICHKSGLNGAPRLGSKKDWESRLAQGSEVLYGHALNGFRGSRGSMPSRGSNPRLSEIEVRAAVDYMTAHAIPSWTMEK